MQIFLRIIFEPLRLLLSSSQWSLMTTQAPTAGAHGRVATCQKGRPRRPPGKVGWDPSAPKMGEIFTSLNVLSPASHWTYHVGIWVNKIMICTDGWWMTYHHKSDTAATNYQLYLIINYARRGLGKHLNMMKYSSVQSIFYFISLTRIPK